MSTEVVNVYRFAVHDSSPHHETAPDGKFHLVCAPDWSTLRPEVQPFAFTQEDGSVVGIAKPTSGLRDCSQHRLDVSRRARDDAQNLAGCCLLLPCLG